MEEVIVKKKRGRKPKVESAEVMTDVVQKSKPVMIEGGDDGSSEHKPKPGKRGRKEEEG